MNFTITARFDLWKQHNMMDNLLRLLPVPVHILFVNKIREFDFLVISRVKNILIFIFTGCQGRYKSSDNDHGHDENVTIHDGPI